MKETLEVRGCDADVNFLGRLVKVYAFAVIGRVVLVDKLKPNSIRSRPRVLLGEVPSSH